MSLDTQELGRTNRLDKLKKVAVKDEYNTQKIPYLIVGSDLSSIKAAEILMGQGHSYLHLLQEKFHPAFLSPIGPSLYRGEDNLNFLKAEYPEVAVERLQETPFFYKDQKFSKLGAKRKPMEISKEESFFKEPAFEFEEKQILPELSFEEIKEHFHYAQIEKIKLIQDQDLLSEWTYEVLSSDKTKYLVNHIIWCESPLSFFRVFDDRKNLPTEFIQYCESVQASWQLILDIKLTGLMEENMETLFLPQSQTYENGHYIVEFLGQNEGHIRILCFLKESEVGNVEMEKKIRNIKSSLKRLFPDILSRTSDEWIYVTQNGPHFQFSDELFESCFSVLKNFSLVGLNAPLHKADFGYSIKNLSGPMRMLASLKQLKKKFLS